MDESTALGNVVHDCYHQLEKAWSALILAVGDEAAFTARTEATTREGYQRGHEYGTIIGEEIVVNAAKVEAARRNWRERFYAYKRVFMLAYPKEAM